MLKYEALRPSEIVELQQLATKIWNDSYTKMISREQIDYMLQKMYSDTQIQQELNLTYSWYFILMNDECIGFTSFYPKGNEMFLSKLYLQREYQGKGLSEEILQFIEQETQKKDLKTISLTVNKNNDKAIKAYQKFGFTIRASQIFDIGKGYVMDDFVLEKNL